MSNNIGADVLKLAASALTKKALIIAAPILIVAVLLLILIVALFYESQTMLPFSEEELILVQDTFKTKHIASPKAEDIVGALIYHTLFGDQQVITADNVDAMVSPFIKGVEKEVLSVTIDDDGNQVETLIMDTVYETRTFEEVFEPITTPTQKYIADTLFPVWLQLISVTAVGELPDGYVVSDSEYTFPAPTATVITSKYGQRWGKMHWGVDIVDVNQPIGAPIVAANDGVVFEVNKNTSHACGNFIRIQHPNGDQTRYCHLTTMTVQSGNTVAKGAVIGSMGETGQVTGPHLHFEMKKNGQNVNPLPYIIDSMKK